nr:PREDICTED: coiled-coil domain-containing protein 138-like [Latimeria chalumnae]|eukprot:XP_014339677.1 PREDICTED: coiled-coil domain-containing protein 138-like [Latimeria chalumnae]
MSGAGSPDLDITVERLKRRYLGSGKQGDSTLSVPGTQSKCGRSLKHTGADISPEKTRLPAKSPGSSGLTYSERKHYNRALHELFKIVRINSDRLDETGDPSNSYPHNSRQPVTEEEFVEEDSELCTMLDTGTHLYTETDVTLPSNLATTTLASVTDSYIEISAASLRKIPKQSESRVWEEQRILPSEISQIYNELSTIREKLQKERAAQQEFVLQLQEREQHLIEREMLLFKHEGALTKIRGVEDEVRTKFQIMKEQHEAEMKPLSEALKEKVKENKRLKSSFDTLKEMNDSLKKQLNEVSEQNKKLETRTRKVQARLENLQRKYEFLTAQKCRENLSKAAQEIKPVKQEKTQTSLKITKAWHRQQQCRFPHIAPTTCVKPAVEEPLQEGERVIQFLCLFSP